MSVLLYFLDLFGGAVVSLPLVMIFAAFFEKKRLKRKWIWLVLYVLYMNAMLIIVGVPGFSYIAWHPEFNFIPFQDFSISNITGMLLNVVMFVPFGFFLPIYFERYQKWFRTLTAGIIMSLLIEAIQVCTFRVSDIDDLLMNTIGTLLGFGIAKLLMRHQRRDSEENKDGVKLLMINGMILLTIIFIRYPLMEFVYKLLGMY